MPGKAGLAHIRRAAIGLHPQKLVEVDRHALVFEFSISVP
jgi:hypothetical protein